MRPLKRQNNRPRPLLVSTLLFSLVILAGCSGNSGGVSSVVGVSIPNVAGGDNFISNQGGSQSVSGVFLNSRILLDFSGPVDPSTLPGPGPATGGGIEIKTASAGIGAVGTFRVNPMNSKQVIFDAVRFLNITTGNQCFAGFISGETYTLIVHGRRETGVTQFVHVSGSPVANSVTGTFSTIACDVTNPGPAFTDPNGAAPQIIAQIPAQGSTSTISSLTGFPTGTVITLDIDEPLDPNTVNPTDIILVNKSINPSLSVPVGGVVSLEPFGSVPGNPSIARISYTTNEILADGHTFEIIPIGVTDQSGKLLIAPAQGTEFTITDNNDNSPSQFFDDFSTTANLESTTGSVVWPGTDATSPHSGRIAAILPLEFLGNGLDGIGNFPASVTINADNQLTPGDPLALPAVFNFTSITFGTGTGAPKVLSFSSTTDVAPGEANFPIHFKSQSTIDFLSFTTLDLNGRRQILQGGTGSSAATTSIPGGWGGPGGGRGGTASPINNPTIINQFGGPGEGAHTSATNPSLPGGMTGNIGIGSINPTGTVNSFYGGGAPGRAGIDLSQTPNPGPSGGGGGTASSFLGYNNMPPANNSSISFTTSTAGETQTGSDGLGAGAPMAGAAGQPPIALITPLSFAVGGSGGGASGDRGRQVSGPLTYSAGGPGGGGGGAIRISSGGNITMNALSRIQVAGGEGGSAQIPLVAHGGGGSGGSILIQTFGQLQLMPSVFLDAAGGAKGVTTPTPPNPEPLLNGEGGRGGDGVVQLEDGTGNFIANDLGSIVVRGELFARVFPLAGTIAGLARSQVIDTGSLSTDYTSALATAVLGSNAMATLDVAFFGIAEDPINPGNPASSATSGAGTPLMIGPLTIAEIDQLDGFRFFMFEVTITYPSPPNIATGETLPFLDDITLNYEN